jgi:hypothetical protein
VNGTSLTDEMRVLVAVQASLLLLGRGDGGFEGLSQVLVYPGAFVVERTQTQADGTLHIGEADHSAPVRTISTVTRAEVRAQTLAAIASGELAELNRSNHNGFEGVTFKAPAATRMAGK